MEAGMSRCVTHDGALRKTCRRMVLVAVLCVLGGGLQAPLASAATAESASLTMTSDQADYVGAGQQYAYDTTANDVFGSSSSGGRVQINVQAGNGDWWYLDFAAPAGQTLAVGTYGSATRFATPATAGLDVGGNGRGCNQITGSFTVNEITVGPFGSLERFAADFEQHCEGAEPALRGQLRLVNAPAPPLLSIGLTVGAGGSVDRVSGSATVSGTITCNRPASVYVSGTLTQRASRFVVASGSFQQQVECSGTTPWRATVTANVPFNPGSARLEASAYSYDEVHGQPVRSSSSATVKLLP